MDDADRAEQREQIKRDEALAFRYPVLLPVGICYNCADSVGSSALFCSVDCAQDHEYRMRLHKQNGIL